MVRNRELFFSILFRNRMMKPTGEFHSVFWLDQSLRLERTQELTLQEMTLPFISLN